MRSVPLHLGIKLIQIEHPSTPQLPRDCITRGYSF